MKYRAFIRALKIPDGVAAHQLFDAAVRDGVKATAEARAIFLETKRADMRAQLRDAQEQGQTRKKIMEGGALPGAARPPMPEVSDGK